MALGNVGVSVVIPTYNRPRLTADALRSVLRQDPVLVREVIVVDDGSDCDLGHLVSHDRRVSVVRHDRNRGAASARNTGISAATGKWVAFLDSDDEWLDEKVVHQLDFMRRNELLVSCTGATRHTADGTEELVRPFPSVIGLEEVVWGCHVVPGSTMIADREMLLRLGGYDPGLPRLEDWDLLIRMAKDGIDIGYLPTSLAVLNSSDRPDIRQVLQALDTIHDRYRTFFGNLGRGYSRRFWSACRFEHAVAWWHEGSRARALFSLAASWVAVPIQHIPLRLQVARRRERLRG